jgi:hypothetical protein
MVNWEKDVDGEQEWYTNEQLGSITKIANNLYVSMFPKLVKLGPFKTFEEAEKALKEGLERLLDQYNMDMVEKLKG